jgi:hypothetical protein
MGTSTSHPYDDDLVVAQFIIVIAVADPGAQGCDQCRISHDRLSCPWPLFPLENLAAQGRMAWKLRFAPLLGRTPAESPQRGRARTLWVIATQSAICRERTEFESGLLEYEVAGFAGSLSSLAACRHLSIIDLPSGVFLQIFGEMIAGTNSTCPLPPVAKLGLGLAFKLGAATLTLTTA